MIATEQADGVYRLLAARLQAAAPEYTVAPWVGAVFIETESGAATVDSEQQYSIEIARTMYVDGVRNSARTVRGANIAHTEVVIRWVDGLAFDDPAASYVDALAGEQRVLQALATPSENEGTGPSRVVIRHIERRTVSSEQAWLIHALHAQVEHTHTLSSP